MQKRTRNKKIQSQNPRQTKKQSAAGFTLIELLVVIAIIGLLASIVLVAMNSARIKARNSRRKAEARALINALELYNDSNNNSYPHDAAAPGNNGNGNGNGNGNNGNGNGNGNNGNGKGNGNGRNTPCTSVGPPNTEVDIQCLANFLTPTWMAEVPNDIGYAQGGENYQYVWKNNAAGIPGEYGLFIPFSNDGGVDCQIQSAGGSANWFASAPKCSY